MTRRREVETHLQTLGEIREIMAAMKNLSFMETRKLSAFIEAQQQAVQTIESAGADFLHFYPQLAPVPKAGPSLFVVIGSERGFCGDYNETLIEQAAERCRQWQCQPFWLPVGSKLGEKLAEDKRVISRLPGAAVAEEVPSVLQQVVATLDELERAKQIAGVSAIYHTVDEIKLTSLLPPFQSLEVQPPEKTGPPFLYLPPRQFLTELTDHYLFAALHALFYSALLAEHQRRIQHLEGALKRLDEQSEKLKVKRNILRQEEITEEIEQILLSAQAVATEVGGRKEKVVLGR